MVDRARKGHSDWTGELNPRVVEEDDWTEEERKTKEAEVLLDAHEGRHRGGS
jgi:hypothetical protein